MEWAERELMVESTPWEKFRIEGGEEGKEVKEIVKEVTEGVKEEVKGDL